MRTRAAQQQGTRMALAALTAAALLTACGVATQGGGTDNREIAGPNEQAKLVKLAKKEGSVTFYSSLPEEENRVFGDAFTKKYGIKVQVVRAGSLEILQRLHEELRTGQTKADVFHTLYPPGFIQLKEEGQLASWKSQELKNYPAQADYVDPGGAWGPLRVVANAIEYNPKALGDLPPPRTWEDLLKPQYKGKLGSADPTYGGTQLMQYVMWREKYGDDYLRKLAAQKVQMVDSHGALSNLVVTGERPIGIEMNDYQAWSDKYIKKAGVDYVYPPKNVLVVPGPVSVLKKAKHPNAARLFFDFTLSKEGQDLMQQKIGAYSARKDAAPIKGRPPFEKLDQYQPNWQRLKNNTAEEQQVITKLMGSK